MKSRNIFNWLFGFLTFLPMLAVGVTSLYTVFNKNAYQSYYGTRENEISYTNVSTLNDFEINKEYVYTGINTDTTNSNYTQARTKARELTRLI